MILVGKPNIVSQIKSVSSFITLENTNINFSETVKSLGVIFDESLSFKQHIKEISKSSMYKLRNLRNIRNHFNKSNFETLIHAFITSKLDFCNSLFSGLPKSTLRPLQLVQNYAARLILRRGRYERSDPLLFQLHWLPISRRIDFKILLLTYKARHNLTPVYISDLIVPANRPNYLRSANDDILHYDLTDSVRIGDCAFSVYAPRIWNALPEEIRSANSVNIFKNKLKTYLFNLEYLLQN